MAYTINGKVYTEHPLMDEMVYNLDIIMEYIEVKDDKLVIEYETEQSMTDSETYMSIMNGTFTFEIFPFTREELTNYYGRYDSNVEEYYRDRYTIPEEDREAVLEFCEQYFLDNYVEYNNYYRALLGLPWIPTDGVINKYYVYIDESYITEDYDYIASLDLFDFSLPLHEYSDYQIQVLEVIGVMDQLYNEYPKKFYKYLRFLGDRKLDLYTIRKASNWDILYMPSVENLVSDRFEELFLINKTVMLHRFYSEAYKLRSEYYDEMMIIILLCQTYTDMIADIPEWYIRRDIFDIRSCKYFLESHGIEFFREIPLKYQIRIVKNMNKLIRYKSTNKNFWDIIDLFTIDTVTIHRYYLYKRRIENEEGSWATGKDPADEYELEFVRTPIGETYDDYIKDALYRQNYDIITYADKYWDGQDEHEYVKQIHYEDNDYTIEGTKFLDIENRISMKEYSFQMEYFVGLLLDSSLDLDDIEIQVSTISSILSFPLSDLFILLFCMTASYDDTSLLIRVPDNKQYGVKPDFDAYDWYDGGDAFTEYVVDINGGPAEEQEFYMYLVDGGYPDTEDYIAMYDGGRPWSEFTNAQSEPLENINAFDPTVWALYRRNVNGGGILRIEYTEVNQETFYNWLAWRHPEVWMDLSNRVYGFNLQADLDELAEIIGFDHVSFGFHEGYTLEQLGVDGFMTADKISSIEELVELYQNNKEIYDNLSDLILNAERWEDKVVYQFVFDYLFTKSFDYSRYTLSSGEYATSYDEILKERNYVLWRYWKNVTSEADLTTRQDAISADMADIIDTLQYYLNYDFLQYIFSAFTVYSMSAIVHYIYLLCNFFKSWKAQFIEAYLTYDLDDKRENMVYANDTIAERKIDYWKKNRVFVRDSYDITIELTVTSSTKEGQVEYLDVYGHYEGIPLFDNDIKGGNMADGWNFLDLDGGPAEDQIYVLNIDGKYAALYLSYTPGSTTAYYYDVLGGDVSTEMPIDDHTHDPSTDLDDGPLMWVDGGGVEWTSYIPYIMLNGGWIGSLRGLFDLDGGGPWEAMVYLNINGKYPESPKEKHNPALSYGANFDGGHPKLYYWRTGSFITRVVDNQILQELRLAPESDGNMIEDTVDGLYLPDIYANAQDVQDIRDQIDALNKEYQSYYDEGIKRILLTSDPDTVNATIKELLDEYLSYALFVYDELTVNVLKRDKEYADKKSQNLVEIYSQWADAYGWGNF